MANCDFNPGHGLSRHVFGGPSPPNHVTPISPQRRLSASGEDELSALYGRCASRAGTGSEWVTLSKSLLLQLVESICQLSFQTEVSSNSTRSEPIRQRHFEPEIELCRSADCVASVMEQSEENTGVSVGNESSETTVAPSGECCVTVVPPPGDVQPSRHASVAESDAGKSRIYKTDVVELLVSTPGDDTSLASFNAACTSSPSPVRTDLRKRIDDSSTDKVPSAGVAFRTDAVGIPDICTARLSPKTISVSADDVMKCDVHNDECTKTSPPVVASPTTKSAIRRQASSRRTTDDAPRFSELAQRRRYIRAHRRHSSTAADAKSQPLADVSRDVIVNCRTTQEDRMPSILLHPVRGQSRRTRNTQQPWVALNKSVVYRMLDVVLSQSAPALPRGADTAVPPSGTVKRSTRTRIWNPAISSAPSSPDYTVDDSNKSDAERHVANASVTSLAVKTVAVDSIGNQKSIDFKIPMELHAMTSSLQPDGGPSLLRNLLDAGDDDVTINARRHSETTPLTSPMYGGYVPISGTPTFPVSYRRRHHSAGRTPDDWFTMSSLAGRLQETNVQRFHNSLMFVDTEHGRDIYNYFRSPDGRPVIASASSLSSSPLCSSASAAALDYTAQTLQSRETENRKSQTSLPELSRSQHHGITPRWVAFNKGDVSTLFESLATAMMATDATSGGEKSTQVAALDDEDDDDVWSDSPSPGGASAARCARTRVVRSAESVFRRPLAAANEPLKWKSSLMRRMRDEVQSKRAEPERTSST